MQAAACVVMPVVLPKVPGGHWPVHVAVERRSVPPHVPAENLGAEERGKVLSGRRGYCVYAVLGIFAKQNFKNKRA